MFSKYFGHFHNIPSLIPSHKMLKKSSFWINWNIACEKQLRKNNQKQKTIKFLSHLIFQKRKIGTFKKFPFNVPFSTSNVIKTAMFCSSAEATNWIQLTKKIFVKLYEVFHKLNCGCEIQ